MGTLTPPYVSGFTRRSWRYQSCLGAPYHHLLGSATSEQTSCGVLPREVKKRSMYRKFTCRTSFTLCEITPFLGASFSMSCKFEGSWCATDHCLATYNCLATFSWNTSLLSWNISKTFSRFSSKDRPRFLLYKFHTVSRHAHARLATAQSTSSPTTACLSPNSVKN